MPGDEAGAGTSLSSDPKPRRFRNGRRRRRVGRDRAKSDSMTSVVRTRLLQRIAALADRGAITPSQKGYLKTLICAPGQLQQQQLPTQGESIAVPAGGMAGPRPSARQRRFVPATDVAGPPLVPARPAEPNPIGNAAGSDNGDILGYVDQVATLISNSNSSLSDEAETEVMPPNVGMHLTPNSKLRTRRRRRMQQSSV